MTYNNGPYEGQELRSYEFPEDSPAELRHLLFCLDLRRNVIVEISLAVSFPTQQSSSDG